MPRVDVQQGEGWPGRGEGLAGQGGQHQGILAARKQDRGLRKLGGRFAQDMNRLVLQHIQMAEVVVGHR